MIEHHKFFDSLALLNVLATMAAILPSIAALLSIVWYGVRLYDRFVHGKKDDS